MIIRPPVNQTILENGELRIPCEAQAEPANFTTKWYKDGIPIRKIQGIGDRAAVLEDGTLRIQLITFEDSGYYGCEVGNGIGQTITQRAYINVECEFILTISINPQFCGFEVRDILGSFGWVFSLILVVTGFEVKFFQNLGVEFEIQKLFDLLKIPSSIFEYYTPLSYH